MLFVVVLSAAVTATVTSGVAAAKAPSAAVGVDPATSTVKIAVIGLNLQALVDAGVVPDLGKPVDQFKELQNEINAGSKAGKYKLDVAVQLLPSQPKPEDYQAACLWATEEQKAFMVVFASVSDGRPRALHHDRPQDAPDRQRRLHRPALQGREGARSSPTGTPGCRSTGRRARGRR